MSLLLRSDRLLYFPNSIGWSEGATDSAAVVRFPSLVRQSIYGCLFISDTVRFSGLVGVSENRHAAPSPEKSATWHKGIRASGVQPLPASRATWYGQPAEREFVSLDFGCLRKVSKTSGREQKIGLRMSAAGLRPSARIQNSQARRQ